MDAPRPLDLSDSVFICFTASRRRSGAAEGAEVESPKSPVFVCRSCSIAGAPAVRLGRRVAEMEAAAPSGAAPESSSAEKAVKLVNQMGEAARVADLAGPSLVTNTLMTLPI